MNTYQSAERDDRRAKRGLRPAAQVLGLALATLIAPGLFPSLASAVEDPPPGQDASGEDSRREDDVPRVPPLPAPEEEFLKVLAEPPRPSVTPDLPVFGGAWVAQGPGPIHNGQVEGIANGPVVGAVQAIVAHPSNPDVVWLGAVNGGVWKTTNATNASPTWVPMGDGFASLSIGALELDPTDGTQNTLVAGIGRFSSFGFVGGPRAGLLRTTDGGSNWTALVPALLTGKNISGLAARGATIVVSVNIADSFTCSNIGIFRSTDTGATFTMISGTGGTGLPLGRAFDLASDPTNNAVLYTAIRDAASCGGLNGVYKSTNTGATWTKVSNASMDALLADAAGVNNTRIAVGSSGEVYAGIIDNGQLGGLFRSATGGASWTQLDTPSTNEGGTVFGIQPTPKPGSQGAIHFSIAADPTNPNIVYVGGDRQPGQGDATASFPNSLGAADYSGRLFRVDASMGAGTQATSLTHCQTATAACNFTVSTTSNSAPHADSRRIEFDAAGNILEADDGGIYRRTNPRTTGDWFSVMGNLRVTEMHDVAYDRVSNMIISGNQDTGTSEQTTVGGTTWNEVHKGDGGDVAVDDTSSATQSTRYSSFQNLQAFRRRTVNASGVTTLTQFPAHTVTSGAAFVAQFVTPVELNAVDATRILIAGSNDLYESLDRGDTMAGLGLNLAASALVYGGRSGAVDNPALIYALNATSVYRRTAGSGAPVLTPTQPGAASLRDIAVDPADWQNAYVVNSIGQVFSTANAGATWTNITGNLGGGTNDLRTVAFVPGNPSAVVVGGANGVFRMATDAVGTWDQFGTGLSNAPVWDLDHDPADNMLVAGTMGRGAWKLDVVANLPTLSIDDVTVTEGNSGTTNAVFTVSLSASSTQTVSSSYATADGTATAGLSSFTNGSSITIPSSGAATPYPSALSVTGLTGTITKVTATISGFGHTWPEDVDVLLVAPGGQKTLLMSDIGGTNPGVSGLNLTFDDAGPALTSSPPVSGTYRPTDILDSATVGGGDDIFPGPAPAGPYTAALSSFDGTSPNGTWSLFVRDDATGDVGQIASGWSLNISTTGGDYVARSGLVTFTPGVTSQTVTVTVNGDTAVEPNETFFVNLSAPAGATVADAQGQGTITNDDGAAQTRTIEFVATTSSVGEASGPALVGVRVTTSDGLLTTTSSSVNFSMADGTATGGSDYTSSSGTITFPPGSASGTIQNISVPITSDSIDEVDETFTISISSPSNAVLGTNTTHTVSIIDDDPPPSLSVNDVTVLEGNTGTVNASFTVTLSPASGRTVTVNYATANGTATAPADYQAVNTPTLTFNPGETTKTVLVLVNGDTIDEADETFLLNLTGPVNATLGDGSGQATITDDDPLPSLAVDDVTVLEGNTGTVNASFTVTLSPASGRTVTVNYATANGTATAPADYQAVNTTTLTFNPGETTKTVLVLVNGDTIDEADETFLLNLTGPVNATLGDGSGQATITDDDPLPSLAVDDVTVLEGNTGTVNASFTVTLSPASGRTVTVNYATANGTATAPADYQAVNTTTLTFNPGETTKTVLVAVNGDTIDEADETFLLNLAGPVNATLGDGSGQATITDDDPLPSLAVDDVTVLEGNTGTVNASFTVTLSPASGRTVTVHYATADGTATAPADYLATNATLAFSPGETLKTLNVAVNGDLVQEPTENFAVNLDSPSNATIADPQGVGTILDDDGSGLDFHTVTPCRLVDTRQPDGPYGGPALTAGQVRIFTLAGQCGISPTAKAISVNLVATAADSGGNLRLYPADATMPLASSLNYLAGSTRSNNAIVGLSATGELAVRSQQAFGQVHFILDVNGYFE